MANNSPKKVDTFKVSLNETKDDMKLSTFKGFNGAERNVSFNVDDWKILTENLLTFELNSKNQL